MKPKLIVKAYDWAGFRRIIKAAYNATDNADEIRTLIEAEWLAHALLNDSLTPTQHAMYNSHVPAWDDTFEPKTADEQCKTTN